LILLRRKYDPNFFERIGIMRSKMFWLSGDQNSVTKRQIGTGNARRLQPFTIPR
jgi:hypothetical protein